LNKVRLIGSGPRQGNVKYRFKTAEQHLSGWMARAMKGHVRIEGNETVLPDEVQRQWNPTFLVRHPALASPSLYRTTVDLQGAEAAKREGACQRLEMMMS